MSRCAEKGMGTGLRDAIARVYMCKIRNWDQGTVRESGSILGEKISDFFGFFGIFLGQFLDFRTLFSGFCPKKRPFCPTFVLKNGQKVGFFRTL